MLIQHPLGLAFCILLVDLGEEQAAGMRVVVVVATVADRAVELLVGVAHLVVGVAAAPLMTSTAPPTRLRYIQHGTPKLLALLLPHSVRAIMGATAS